MWIMWCEVPCLTSWSSTWVWHGHTGAYCICQCTSLRFICTSKHQKWVREGISSNSHLIFLIQLPVLMILLNSIYFVLTDGKLPSKNSWTYFRTTKCANTWCSLPRPRKVKQRSLASIWKCFDDSKIELYIPFARHIHQDRAEIILWKFVLGSCFFLFLVFTCWVVALMLHIPNGYFVEYHRLRAACGSQGHGESAAMSELVSNYAAQIVSAKKIWIGHW